VNHDHYADSIANQLSRRGTDYPEYFEKHGGAVLGTAVDKSAFFNMSQFYSKMFDYSIRIAYRKVECVRSIEDLEHAPFRECLRWAEVTQDIEINHASELPAFTGLGSSSAFVVGLLNTLYAFRRRLIPRLDLAYEAIDLERNVLHESVGCQDQTLAAVGGFNLIEFRRMGNFAVHRIPFSRAASKSLKTTCCCFSPASSVRPRSLRPGRCVVWPAIDHCSRKCVDSSMKDMNSYRAMAVLAPSARSYIARGS